MGITNKLYGNNVFKKVTTDVLVADSEEIGTDEIEDGAITNAKLDGTSVTTAKILDDAVTVAKMLLASGTASIGTAATTVAHGLGASPTVVLITPNGTTGGVYQSSAADGTNLTFISETAATCQWVALA